MPWLADLTAAILQRVLGRYVTGLDGRSLKLAVWSGRVVLERLTLRPDALLGLLPVHVRAGFVGRIVMVVPWHKLGTLPVTVELHDVHVLASPLNEELWTDEQEAAYGWAQKQAKLRAREHEVQALLERLLARSAADAAEDGSFSATLLARVVENVHLSVVGLHRVAHKRAGLVPAPVDVGMPVLIPGQGLVAATRARCPPLAVAGAGEGRALAGDHVGDHVGRGRVGHRHPPARLCRGLRPVPAALVEVH